MINTIWIDNLIKVLEYENKLYRRLLAIAEDKTGTVVHGELKNLQESVAKEQKLVNELDQLKIVREQILDQIGKKLGKNTGELTITDFIDTLPDEQAQKLSVVKGKLKKTIDGLTAKNDLNQKLIRNALEYVDFSLNLLTQPVPQTPQYGRRGNETEIKNRGMLDIKY